MRSDLRIRGVVPPVPTPFDSSGRVDQAALGRILNRLVAGGCHGTFILGSTGELASLDAPSREAVIRTAVREIAGRIPVLVGITDTCPAATLELGRRARDLGADALVMAAPFYYELDGDELRRYISLILEQVELPTMLYNMPWLTGHVLDAGTLRAAMEYPHLIGFKDSSGDLDYLGKMIAIAAARPGVTVLVGNENLHLAALELGAHGVVGGGGNIYPALLRALQDAFERGDFAVATALQSQVTCLGEQIFGITGRPTSGFAAIKAALACLGLCEPHMAPPLTACTPAEIEALRRVLASTDVLLSNDSVSAVA